MKDFFSNYPLYKKFTISLDYKRDLIKFSTIFGFKDITFDYFCPEENGIKTFVTTIDEPEVSFFGRFPANYIPDSNKKNGYLDYYFKCTGYCQSCKTEQVYFLLRVSSGFDEAGNATTLLLEKIGVFPQIKVLPNPEISKFFDRESNNWYFKGINSITENYGIGALAYFRRIIEKELIHIIEEIKKLPDADTTEIQTLLDEHVKHPAVTTIYENIFHHLPSSLRSLGENPIKLLYNLTSEGLHSLTEAEAMQKADGIQQLLEFVIIKINEEKSNIKSLKDTIRALKG